MIEVLNFAGTKFLGSDKLDKFNNDHILKLFEGISSNSKLFQSVKTIIFKSEKNNVVEILKSRIQKINDKNDELSQKLSKLKDRLK